MNFSRQMAAFVAAGIPLTDGLQVIAKGSTNRHWQEVLGEASEAITQGTQFSDALARNADLFPPYYLGIVKAAEMTGRLDLALVQVSDYLERDLETKSRINQALAYPLVVLAMAGVTVSVLSVWVLPKFATFFSGLGAKLPLTTRILIGFANFTQHFWWVYALMFGAMGAVLYWLLKTERGRRIRNRATLRIPLVKVIVLYSVVERVDAHSRRDVARRCSAARRDGRGDPWRQQQRVRGRVAGRADAHARGRRTRRADRRHRTVSRSCHPDDACG